MPGAAGNALISYAAGQLHLRLTAPPRQSVANQACCVFVAGLLDVPKSQVTLVLGAKSRSKVLEVTGLSAEEMDRRLAQRAAAAPSAG